MESEGLCPGRFGTGICEAIDGWRELAVWQEGTPLWTSKGGRLHPLFELEQ